MATTTFEDILKKEGTLVYTNVGVSMMPLLRQGRDLMVIEDVQGGRDVTMGRPLKRLDSVLFKRSNGQYVLHRIMDNPDEVDDIQPEKKVYRICGDNTMQLEPVRREQIIGRLVEVERRPKKGQQDGWHIHVDSKGYRAYSWMMWGLWPMRRVYFPIRWGIGRIVKPILWKIRKRKNVK